jgi:hypothetical protein
MGKTESFFNFAEAMAESMVEPHRMTDNFTGEKVTLVAGSFVFHAAQSVKPELPYHRKGAFQ